MGFGLSIVQILEELKKELGLIELIHIRDNGKDHLVHMLVYMTYLE